jgi:hypothetical protein
MISVGIAALFYQLLGLYCLFKMLQSFQLKASISCLVVWATSFGTNLFIYTVSEPGMSHVFSFAAVAFFLLLGRKYLLQPKLRLLSLLAITLGLIVLLRPINGLVLLGIPLLASSALQLKNGFLFLFHQKIRHFFILFVLGLSFPSLQLLFYKASLGKFMVDAYSNEGFDFLNPHFLDILFSYKKGLFLYTPFYLLAFLSGCLAFLTSQRWKAIYWLLFFSLITYIFSSWWMWYYGGSFSSRVYIEYLPFFALFIGLGLQKIQYSKLKPFVYGLLFCIIAVCQIQSYQYRYYDVHYSDMTKEKYWEVFLMRNKLKSPDSSQ